MIDVNNLRAIVQNIAHQIDVWKKSFESRNVLQRLDKLEPQAENPNIWNLPNAKEILIEFNALEDEVNDLENISLIFNSLKDLIETAQDQELLSIAENELLSLKERVETIYINTMFSQKEDSLNCFLSINSGSGGQEAEDWARMLWEMYLKYTNNYYHITILEETYSDDGGIKSATMKVNSHNRKFPFGWLKGESGVHRLVRISPYDKKKQRHTSFASVYVTPEIEDNKLIEIDEKDLKIDTYRASGAGGQHVNKTESAIRITHLPTKIVVQCQNDRSQHRNKDEAMKMLRSKLFQKQKQEKMAQQAAKEGEKKEISWGSQIRSYVKHPYQMVKDIRTGYEVPNFDKVVFEGNIEEFLVAYLKSII